MSYIYINVFYSFLYCQVDFGKSLLASLSCLLSHWSPYLGPTRGDGCHFPAAGVFLVGVRRPSSFVFCCLI